MNNDYKNINEEHLIAYLTGDADTTLIQKVEEWLSLSPENAAKIDEIEKIWLESGKLNPAPVPVDIDAAWNKLSSRIDSSDNKVVKLNIEKKGITKFTRTLLRVAAVLILAVGAWSIIIYTLNGNKQQTLLSQNSVINEKLSDGSKVSLNANSKLIYPEEFAGKTREVELEGEAFFEIEPNKEKPFIIHSENANIKVLGTSFNVKAYSDLKEIEVAVNTGVVMLFTVNSATNDTTSVILHVGEKGIYNKENKTVEKSGTVSADELYWLNRTLIFKETELKKVIEMLQDCYNVTITVENDNANTCRLNAIFKNESIDEILDVIAASFNLKVVKDKDKNYTLNGNGC